LELSQEWSYKQNKQITLHVLNLSCDENHPRYAHGHWQPEPVHLCSLRLFGAGSGLSTASGSDSDVLANPTPFGTL